MAWHGYCKDLVYKTLQQGWLEVNDHMSGVTTQESPRKLLDFFYGHEDPLIVCYGVMLTIVVVVWLWSIVFQTAALTDRIWSITPGVYTAIMVRDAIQRAMAGQRTPSDDRQLLMLALCVAWCCRLTGNFMRKGGYSYGFEDHRWPWLRAKLHPIIYHIFNIVFISFYQHWLLLLISTPAYVAALAPHSQGFQPLDVAAAALFSLLLAGETISDNQQWTFQTRKYALKALGKKLTGEYADGFLQSGLFRYSRHPNFFCELSIWWAFYLFGVSASGCWASPAMLGTVLLTLLFLGSTAVTEVISASKYPAYKRYQRTTSQLVPWFPRKAAAKRE